MTEAIILAGGLGTRLKKNLKFKSKTLTFVKKKLYWKELLTIV